MDLIESISHNRAAFRARLAGTLALFAGALLVSAGSAVAAEHTLDFDDRSPGAVVSSGPGGLTLHSDPVIINAGNDTQSPPNALRMPGDCPDSGGAIHLCSTGDHLLELRFANPARSVSLRTGLADPGPCFELDCPDVKLVGFDASGQVVALDLDSIPHGDPITTPLTIEASQHVISRAVLGIAEDPETGEPLLGSQWTAQIDDLSYDVLEEGDPPPPPPPPPPSPPRVSIASPSAGDTFATTDVDVSGTVSAPAGLAGFCVEANGGASLPTACNRVSAVADDGSFSVLRVRGMRPGANTIRVWARDTRARTASATVTVNVAGGDVDFRVETMEITQAVQVEDLPLRTVAVTPSGETPRLIATYDGVPLSRSKKTIVRLFGAARGAPSPVQGATAMLRGYRRSATGSPLRPLGTLRPLNRPNPLEADPDLAELRADPNGAFNFMLPPEWVRHDDELVLQGELAPSTVRAPALDCCAFNNVFEINGIEFTPVRAVAVLAVSLRWTNTATNGCNIPAAPPGVVQRPSAPLTDYFDFFKAVWPGRVVAVDTGREFDISDEVLAQCRNPGTSPNSGERANLKLYEAWERSQPDAKIVGLNPTAFSGGLGPSPTAIAGLNDSNVMPIIVAHETAHTIGLAHPPPSGDDTPGCEKAGGPLNGVGIDPRYGSGPAVGTFNVITEGAVSDQAYDYMSRACQAWVSTPYWANTVRQLAPGGRLDVDWTSFDPPSLPFLTGAADPTVRASARRTRSAGRRGKPPIVRVSAVLGADGDAAITRVEPDRGSADEPATSSDVTVAVRDHAGSEISRTPVHADTVDEPGLPASRLLSAAVPGGSEAARVEIEVSGEVVASREASANPPTARLRRPRNGARIGANGRFPVRWRASDADGNPLEAKIQFSSDRGRTWHTLTLGERGRRTRIPGSLLPRTRKGMLRIVISDGFNVARSVVRRIRAAGGRPRAEITSPGQRRATVLGDTVVVLEGSASDATGKPLRGKRLVWTSKGKRLGRGEQLGVAAHRLGRTVTLAARDRSGRRGMDKVRFRVRKVEPLFTTLRAKRLGRKTRKLKLRLASTLPGKVIVRGAGLKRARARLGRRTRTVSVKARGRRRSAYRVKLKLKASGKSTRQMLVVRRRG